MRPFVHDRLARDGRGRNANERPVTIGASTRLLALLGQPVAGSLSPRMQNAAFAARGLDWAYVPVDLGPEALTDAVRGRRLSPHGRAPATSATGAGHPREG